MVLETAVWMELRLAQNTASIVVLLLVGQMDPFLASWTENMTAGIEADSMV